jgi:hypothetical protein
MFTKEKNKQKTFACIVKDDVLNELSVFVRQKGSICTFSDGGSWVIRTDIERRIKEKIERIGIPLKDWGTQINYGVKTGFNEAFIIDGVKRKELIEQDPKSEEIIRPVLRGRDIKRYGYNFENKYLITTFPSKTYNIDNYPAVKRFLEGFKPKLKQTGEILTDNEIIQVLAHANKAGISIKESELKTARKKTNNKWFETQDSISYSDDFNRQKIVWGEISDKANFALDDGDEYFINNKCYLLTGDRLEYLTCFLNSRLSEYLFSKIATTTGVGTLQWSKFTIEQLQVPSVTKTQENEFGLLLSQLKAKKISEAHIDLHIYKLCGLSAEEIEFIESQ